ncbi:MAG: hypothetical protein WAU47_08770 [Desulfobaccales bacterium]
MHRRLTRILCGLVTFVLLTPRPSLALELLWETQGSYVHQMAHLLFAVAMVFLIYEIRRGQLRGTPGFRNLMWACIFLTWWNLDSIIGHALDWSLQNPVILGEGLDRRLLMEDWHTWGYYLFKITHFFLPLPAFYFFYRSLREFSREEEARGL